METIDAFNRKVQVKLFRLAVCLLLVPAAGGASVYASITEPGTGEMEFIVLTERDGVNKTRRRLPGIHLGTDVSMRISGVVVEVTLIQAFRNPGDQWAEGRYVFPLPGNSAVYGMEMMIGERRIIGEIREKEEAREIYREVKESGGKAALIEQYRPNLFSQQAANIAPGETVRVTLRYRQTAGYRDGMFSVYFPMTLTPRYIAAHRSGNRDANRIYSPFTDGAERYEEANTAALSVILDAGLPTARITSPYHDIDIRGGESQYRISFADGPVLMDRDFVLEWEPVPGTQPRAAVFHEAVNDEDYRLVMLMPPMMNLSSMPRLSRDVIFIIDTSGSMGGTSIEQAKAGLLFGLGQLGGEDRFNIIEFNSHFQSLFDLPAPADEFHRQRAERFVRRLNADGGTEMRPALNAAFNQLAAVQSSAEGARPAALRQIVFITDGSIANEGELFQFIYKRLRDVRIHTVGIGSAPNRYFMRKTAEFGRGTYTHIGTIGEVEESMSALFEKISRPVMHSIKIIGIDDSISDILPSRIPDLYHGEPLVIHIRGGYESDEIVIEGMYRNQPWEQSLSFSSDYRHPGAAGLWARKKIESLMDEVRTGNEDQSIKDQVTSIALTHRLMSPYTSFVAFEETPPTPRPPSERLIEKAVPNQVPHGGMLQMVPYPDTAVPLGLNFLIGAVLLLTASVLRYGRFLAVAGHE